jgi:hypothetical protein
MTPLSGWARHNIPVIEDAAHASTRYQGKRSAPWRHHLLQLLRHQNPTTGKAA